MYVKHFIAIFFLLLTFAFITSNAMASTSVLPIEHWTSKSGVPVYFVAKTQVPIVDIAVIFHAGSAYDSTSPGIAQLTAQMLDQGTHNFDANEIANRFESAGAHYNAGINQDMAIVQLRSLSEPQFFNVAFNTFVELISQANFPEDALQREKKQARIALQQEEQTPTAIAIKAFYKDLYAEHPYASPLLGTTQGIDQITHTELINFYQRYYVAQNAMIAIVGNITKEKAISLADQLSSALPRGKKVIPLAKPSSQLSNQHYKIHYPSQQSTILLGQLGITLKDPDYFPLLIGNQILGGGILTSQLFTEVRNKRGLCYGISSSFNTLQAGGPFLIGLQTRKSQAATALAVTQATLKNFIEKGPSEQELVAAKQALIGSFPLSIANNAAILAKLEKIGFYELPLNYLDDYREKINNVSVKQVRDAFQKHINPGKLLVVTLGEN